MALCEWNPTLKEAALCGSDKRDTDCSKEATLIVGADGLWHICEACASMPEFRRFRARRPLRKGKIDG